MTDSPQTDGLGRPRVYTVSGLTGAIKELLEGDIGPVWLEGEVSNPRRPASGHLYFSLKDSGALLKAVLFRNRMRYASFKPNDGDQVLAFGLLGVYEPRGEYQLIVDHLEPLGAGALAAAFEQLKAKLAEEGLFNQDRKKPWPTMPARLAVVTSPTGAALWDFLRVLGRRFDGLEILVYPVRVQGDSAPGEIARALDEINRDRPDVDGIVVARGGGSLEDLWAFNTEEVARAIARSARPVMSAVGHEVDFTIADFTADVRASTPSAAGELVITPKADWQTRIEERQNRLADLVLTRLTGQRSALGQLTARLIDPRRRLIDQRLRLAELTDRLAAATERALGRARSDLDRQSDALAGVGRRGLTAARRQRIDQLQNQMTWLMKTGLDRNGGRLAALAERLQALSPLAVLGRGYSLTRDRTGSVIYDSDQAAVGDRVEVLLNKGALVCLVEGKK